MRLAILLLSFIVLLFKPLASLKIQCPLLFLLSNCSLELIQDSLHRWPLDNIDDLIKVLTAELPQFASIYDNLEEISPRRKCLANIFHTRPELHEALFNIIKLQSNPKLADATIFHPEFNGIYHTAIGISEFKPQLFTFEQRLALIELMKRNFPKGFDTSHWQLELLNNTSLEQRRCILKQIWPILQASQITASMVATPEELFSIIFPDNEFEMAFVYATKLLLVLFYITEETTAFIPIIRSMLQFLVEKVRFEFPKAPWDSLLSLSRCFLNEMKAPDLIDKVAKHIKETLFIASKSSKDNLLILSAWDTFVDLICTAMKGRSLVSYKLLSLFIEIIDLNPEKLTLLRRQQYIDTWKLLCQRFKVPNLWNKNLSIFWLNEEQQINTRKLRNYRRSKAFILARARMTIRASWYWSSSSIMTFADLFLTLNQIGRDSSLPLNNFMPDCKTIDNDKECTKSWFKILQHNVKVELNTAKGDLINWEANCIKQGRVEFIILALSLRYMFLGGVKVNIKFLPPPHEDLESLENHFIQWFKDNICSLEEGGPSNPENTVQHYATLLLHAFRNPLKVFSWRQIYQALERKTN